MTLNHLKMGQKALKDRLSSCQLRRVHGTSELQDQTLVYTYVSYTYIHMFEDFFSFHVQRSHGLFCIRAGSDILAFSDPPRVVFKLHSLLFFESCVADLPGAAGKAQVGSCWVKAW